tara:strand:+ start:137 stop:730 length:594 start_codon:yes stop_codon:yes gene_type:complete
MKSIYNFVVTPVGERYNNKKQVEGRELILNTDIEDHKYINRKARVISTPTIGEDLGIKPGDIVITHFNVFRRWYDLKGKERNSRSYFNEKTYLINHDQIFLYKRNEKWLCPKGYCFIQPIKETDKLSLNIEKTNVGVVKYTDQTVNINDLVGYKPNTQCEFVVDNIKLYRILSNLITIKYEYQGNEEVYNPSWAQGG